MKKALIWYCIMLCMLTPVAGYELTQQDQQAIDQAIEIINESSHQQTLNVYQHLNQKLYTLTPGTTAFARTARIVDYLARQNLRIADININNIATSCHGQCLSITLCANNFGGIIPTNIYTTLNINNLTHTRTTPSSDITHDQCFSLQANFAELNITNMDTYPTIIITDSTNNIYERFETNNTIYWELPIAPGGNNQNLRSR